MASPNVRWPTCREAECIGVRLDTGTCLAHADGQDRTAALKEITKRGKVDARGVTISPGLLTDILAAVRPGYDGHPRLAGADFTMATFTGEARFAGANFRDTWFAGATFTGEARFDKATFTREARFDRATFTREARFDKATFTGDAMFIGATFQDNAWFLEANFTGHAGFYVVTVQGRAVFSGATFQEVAEFGQATFTGDASFGGTTFTREAQFDKATFTGDAEFDKATFTGDALFREATFECTQRFGPVLAHKLLGFDGALFREPVVVEASAVGLSCRRTRFPAGVQFRIRRAQVDLDDTDLSVPSLITGIPRLSDDELADADERKHGDGPDEQPRIISLRRANVAALGLSNVNLAECRFAGAHNLDMMRLDGDITFALSPARAGWERRQVIAEETQWRATRPQAGRWTAPQWTAPQWTRTWSSPGWAGGEPPPLDPGTVAGIYRALRKGREDAKDEPGAADFYYGEMEMRRHTAASASERETGSRGRADRVILTLYWATSGYGLRAWRSFAALACLAALITVLLTGWGLAASTPPQTLRGTTTTGRISAALRPTTPHLPPAGQRWTGERVRTSAEVALDSFVFRTTDLPLTPAGTWIEDLARILGTLLLALGLLAIRNRVKR